MTQAEHLAEILALERRYGEQIARWEQRYAELLDKIDAIIAQAEKPLGGQTVSQAAVLDRAISRL